MKHTIHTIENGFNDLPFIKMVYHARDFVLVKDVLNLISEWYGTERHQVLFLGENLCGASHGEWALGINEEWSFAGDNNYKDLIRCLGVEFTDTIINEVRQWERIDGGSKFYHGTWGIPKIFGYEAAEEYQVKYFMEGIHYISMKSRPGGGADMIYVGDRGFLSLIDKDMVEDDCMLYGRGRHEMIEEVFNFLSTKAAIVIRNNHYMHLSTAWGIIRRLEKFIPEEH